MADGLFHHAEALLASAEAGSTCSIGIEDYASRIARRHLINAFADLLEIPVESGEEIVRFFVGAGAGISDSIDHWAAPLVALDEESVRCLLLRFDMQVLLACPIYGCEGWDSTSRFG